MSIIETLPTSKDLIGVDRKYYEYDLFNATNKEEIYDKSKGAKRANVWINMDDYVTHGELNNDLQRFFGEVADIIKIEFDRREDYFLENAKMAVREEIQKSLIKTSLKNETTIFLDVVKELKTNISKLNLPKPCVYFKEIDSEKIINVVIEDSENYIEHLLKFSEIVNNIYREYDLDLEILFFEKGEIINPFEEQGFKELKE